MSQPVDDLLVKLTLDGAQFVSETNSATGALQGLDSQIAIGGVSLAKLGSMATSSGALVAAGVSASVAAIGGVVAGIAQAASVSADFETSMNRVAAISRATDEDFGRLRETAIKLGSSTKFSASEAAEGMAFLAMAGFDTNEVIAAMPALLDLAAASGMALGEAADITSNILGQFGMEAAETGRLADILALGAASANTSVSQLGQALSFVGPVAAALGLSVSDTAAMIGVLGDSGIQATRAGTGLRAMMSDLVNPSKDSAEAIAALGVNLRNADGSMRPFIDVVRDLSDAGLDADSAFKIFGDRSATVALILSSSLSSYDDLAASLSSADGAARQMAETMGSGAKGAMVTLSSATEALFIAIGDLLGTNEKIAMFVGGIASMVQGVAGAISSFADWHSEIQAWSRGIGEANEQALQPFFDEIGLVVDGAGALATELREQIGAALMPWAEAVGAMIVETRGFAGEALASLISQLGTFSSEMKDALAAVVAGNPILSKIKSLFDEWAPVIIRVATALGSGGLSEAMRAATSGLEALRAKGQEVRAEKTMMAAATDKARADLDAMAKAADAATKQSAQLAQKVEGAGKATRTTTNETKDAKRALEEADRAAEKAAKSWASLDDEARAAEMGVALFNLRVNESPIRIDEKRAALERATTAMQNIAQPTLAAGQNIQGLGQAADTTSGQLDSYSSAIEDVRIVLSEMSAAHVDAAAQAMAMSGVMATMTQASIDANVELLASAGALSKIGFEAGELAKPATSSGGRSLVAVSTAVTDLGKALVDTLIGEGSFGQKAVAVFKNLGTTIAREFVENGLNAAMNGLRALLGMSDDLTSFGGTLGGIFGSIFGGGGAGGAAGTVAGQAGGIGGQIASAITSSLSSTVTAVASAVSAVTDVIGVFQNMRMNDRLKLIEENTRFAQIGIIGDSGLISWTQELSSQLWGHRDFLLKLPDIHGRLVDIQDSVLPNRVGSPLDRVVDLLGDILREMRSASLSVSLDGQALTNAVGSRMAANEAVLA